MDQNRTTIVLFSDCAPETVRIGRILGELLNAGDCVALVGDLGAGKTCLTQGIAQGLGIPAGYAVTSPTFTLLNEYPGGKTSLYHLDVYRLSGPADLAEMGFEEYLSQDGVMVIEWADKIERQVPEGALHILFSILEENVRKIEITGPRNQIESCTANMQSGRYQVPAPGCAVPSECRPRASGKNGT
ncbi:MAG: tRNA (adenosine(37)-N6)-threonylcarbamoyltransferase complex ATPase subunit type 1 TsaE [Syntrophales bacterium]